MALNITKEILEDLYLNQLLSQETIGRMFQCDRKTIAYYMKKFNIPRRTANETKRIIFEQKTRELTKEVILSHVEDGWLLDDICKHYQVTRSLLSKITKKLGLNFTNHPGQRKNNLK